MSTGADDPGLSGLSAGTYGVTATNNIGCVRSLEFQIVEPDPPFIELTADGAALAASQGFASYIWLLNGEPVDSTQEATFTATQSGDYSVLVTDASGCSFSSGSVSVVVSGISEAELGLTRLVVSPNPFTNALRIEMDAPRATTYRLRLMDTRGQTLYQWEEPVARGWRKDLELSQLPTGMYLLGISANGKELVRKVQKQ
ncbi:MAG: T9SS type A sorting domain-containing protein [Saprospiraceae bacterium]|nr:T9SS type A sorting domain-containing protein [Saprospiraceae bacterium]